MTGKIIVYSAVTSSYDMVFKPKVCTENVQYVLFSDQPGETSGWNVLPIKNMVHKEGALTNRWYKFFPHEVFEDAEYSVYVDGNIRIIGDLGPLIQEFKESGAALGVFRHLERTNISQEAEACLELGKFDDQDKDLVKDQLEMYSESGVPPNLPLTDNGIIFRWHKHPKLSGAMSSWWAQLRSFSKRDQISLPYVVWKDNLPVKKWDWSFRVNNSYFEVYPHRRSLLWDTVTVIRLNRNDYWWSKLAYSLMNRMRYLFR